MRATTDSAVFRPDLGVAVMEYVEGATMGLIGLEVFPIFKTPKNSSTFSVIPKEALLKLQDTARAPRGGYNRGDFPYERGKYITSEQGWEEPIDDTERALFDQEAPGMADFIATNRAMGIIMKGQEKRIADKLFNASNFTANSITHEWDDSANAVPINDVNTGITAFRIQCGMLPDALVIAYSTFMDLRVCDQIIDQLKYTFPGIDLNNMTSMQLAQLFGVPRVLVGGAVYDAAGKGIDSSISDIWSNEYAALVKISSGPDLTQPGVGRTFVWTEDSAENPIVEQYREEAIRSDVYRVRHNVDERLIQSIDTSEAVKSNVAAACVYLFDNITT